MQLSLGASARLPDGTIFHYDVVGLPWNRQIRIGLQRGSGRWQILPITMVKYTGEIKWFRGIRSPICWG